MTATASGGLRKVRRGTFVQVPSSTIRDRTLSYRARGVLSFLLDHPDGFDVRAEYLAGHGAEGRDAIESALRELRTRGYYRLERRRLPDGTFAMGTAIAEEPVAEWVDSHRRHAGRAVPCRVLEDGTVVELGAAPEPEYQGPVDQGPDNLAPVARSLSQTENTDREGEEPAEQAPAGSHRPLAEQPPTTTTQRHTCPGPCGPCADDRRRTTAAADEVAVARRAREAADRAKAAELRRLELDEVAACHLCDEDGTAVVDGIPTRCTHDDAGNRARVATRQASRTGWRQYRTQEA